MYNGMNQRKTIARHNSCRELEMSTFLVRILYCERAARIEDANR